jgi:hypothetical protein
LRWEGDAAAAAAARPLGEGDLAPIEWTEVEASGGAPARARPSEPGGGGLFTETEETQAGAAPRNEVSLWTEEERSKVKTLPRSAPAATRRRRSEQDGPRPKKARRRGRRIVGAICFVLATLFVADLVYAGLALRGQLGEAADRLDEARGDLQAGRLESARSALDDASARTESAEDVLSQPALQILGALPLAGQEVDAIDGIVAVAQLVSDAGRPGLEAADLLEYHDGAVGSTVYENGRINLDLLAEVQPLLLEVEELLQQAAREAAEIARPILPPLRSALEDARTQVGDAASVASGGVSLLRALPRLAGASGDRKYLLAFQALGEARATGGVAGLFGVLGARDGKLRLGRIDSYRTIFGHVSPKAVPSWYRQTYGIQGALDEWPQANLSPNFPVGARVMLEYYEETFGRRLDGVIAVDAVALAALMEGTGPFEVEGFDEKITSDNVVRILSEDAYVDFPTQRSQNEFLSALIRTFWDRIESGDVDVQALARGVGDAVGTQHLKIFVTDQKVRNELEELNADGSIERFGRNLQMVFTNNYGVNKVDYYLHRSIDTRVEVGQGGDVRVRTEVTLRNEAPDDGEPSDLLGGIENDLPPGTNRQTLSFLAPTGAKLGALRVDGKTGGSIVYTDSKHPVVWDVVTIPPGEKAVVSLVYVVKAGATLDEDGGTLSLTLLPQPMLNVDELTATVVAPGGYAIEEGGTSMDELVVERAFDKPVVLEARFEPAS